MLEQSQYTNYNGRELTCVGRAPPTSSIVPIYAVSVEASFARYQWNPVVEYVRAGPGWL